MLGHGEYYFLIHKFLSPMVIIILAYCNKSFQQCYQLHSGVSWNPSQSICVTRLQLLWADPRTALLLSLCSEREVEYFWFFKCLHLLVMERTNCFRQYFTFLHNPPWVIFELTAAIKTICLTLFCIPMAKVVTPASLSFCTGSFILYDL